MKVGLVAVHYPHDGYRDELIDVFKRAAQVMRQTPGCLGTECWVNSADGSIVTTGRWESDEALDAVVRSRRGQHCPRRTRVSTARHRQTSRSLRDTTALRPSGRSQATVSAD